MSDGCIPITVSPGIGSQSIQIQVNPAFAITPVQSSSVTITPVPLADQSVELSIPTGTFTIDSVIDGTTSTVVGGIQLQNDINLSVGTSTSSGGPNLLNSFIVNLPDFTITNAASYSIGDCVVLVPGSNAYNADITAASTDNLEKGAYNNIWLFYSYSGNNLVLLQKGYFDFSMDSSNFGDWVVGRTLYLNALGQIDILPTTGSAHWVKSLGYCIPNTENKKRIWFEPDTTYLKIA